MVKILKVKKMMAKTAIIMDIKIIMMKKKEVSKAKNQK